MRSKNIVRRLAVLVIFGIVGAYGYFALRGPQGLPALRDKWREVRKLEEENAELQRQNDYRRDRIKKLQENPSEQELEIRKQLKLLRPGETSFILPEQPKQDGAAQPKPADSAEPHESKE